VHDSSGGPAVKDLRCPKCHGNLYYEADTAEGLMLRKCLQCGLIESYFWFERTRRMLIPLPVEHDQPVESGY
jgi:hypothetical protein